MPNNPKIKVIYSNHVLQAPDGTPISRIGADRSEWYLERGLARVVKPFPFKFSRNWPFVVRNDSPLTIRLTFEPKGRGHEGDEYYLADKLNKCVVCGAEDDINKHHVIPRVYRKHMPEEYKGRTSHDVVVLCISCHTRYEVEADKRKRQIAAALGFEASAKKLCDLSPEKIQEIKARKLAVALLRNGPNIPWDRCKEMEAVVAQFADVADAASLEAFAFQTKHYLPNYLGDEMAKYVLARVDLHEFGLGWRRHFVETMMPQHLPTGWDVERPLSRTS